MRMAARKIKRLSRKKTLSFPIVVPAYAIRGRAVNPLFRLAHYSLFSRMARSRSN